MKRFTLSLLLALSALPALPITIDGTVCRMNRGVDRLIVGSDAGPRVRVALERGAITFRGLAFDRADLRPGDRVHLLAVRGRGTHLLAQSIEVTMRVDDALVDSIFRSHRTVVGRFAVREAKTEFFSLRLPQQRYLRVDAKAAYGPNGRVWVSSLKPGDLLEIRGMWPSKDLLRASSITVITDREPSFCRTQARRGEIDAETASRDAYEQLFMDKGDH